MDCIRCDDSGSPHARYVSSAGNSPPAFNSTTPPMPAARRCDGGWGGALGFADPGAGVGFGYVTNRMLGFDDSTPQGVDDAVYDEL
ncbi:hypothetical protein X762_02500 [Mesorhizobium sp. LSHC426A00]|nr:hypothetical protein X762_02500 [Mesorhizobium sp. LSHC426A00]ESX59298.1 hypothetical protein X761_02295 [Mesorhizobium sp. LSHC424B00]ESX76385.1 hypothetical protein X758_01480 [Mesorhizobium sp. LSHC416B00]